MERDYRLSVHSRTVSNICFRYHDNIITNVTIGVQDNAGRANLLDILLKNTFPAGSHLIGSDIIVPEFYEGKAHNVPTGEDYTTIQAAINAAIDGDVILVGAGTYDETLSIGKPLSLIGSSNLDTIINGAVTISAGNVVLGSLTIDARGTYPTYESAFLSQPNAPGVVAI